MIKKLMLLATMAMVLTGIAASMAQGEAGIQWKDNTKNLLADGTIELTGNAKFSNAVLGGVECPVIAHVTLTKGTSTAHIVSFKIEKTSECKLNGLLSLECSELTGHEYTNLPWSGTGTKTGAIDISGVSIHNTFKAKGAKCPSKLTLESTATAFPVATLDSTSAATKATLSGSLTTTGPAGEHLGAANITGTLNILAPNSGTYGIGA